MKDDMQRYAVIPDKRPREIVLLKGQGCRWHRCAFCDYYLDGSPDAELDFALNKEVLSLVTGKYHTLEVINSGSFSDLDRQTMREILRVCVEKRITELHFECHWMDRFSIPEARASFGERGIALKIKTGVETFDPNLREKVLHKGIGETDPAKIAEPFDECCLLQGLAGQTKESMLRDIEIGLTHFDRVCVNLMNPNQSAISPDPDAVRIFLNEVLPVYQDNDRVDLLINNTDFGVGGSHEK